MHGLELAQVWNLIWCIIFIHEESVKPEFLIEWAEYVNQMCKRLCLNGVQLVLSNEKSWVIAWKKHLNIVFMKSYNRPAVNFQCCKCALSLIIALALLLQKGKNLYFHFQWNEDAHPGPHHLGPYTLDLGISVVWLWLLTVPSSRAPSSSLGDPASQNCQALPNHHLKLSTSLLYFK